MSDILSSICIKRVGFNNYLKNAGRLLSQISFLDPKPENMPQTNSRQVHESKCFKLCKCNFVQNVLVINFKYMLHSQCCHQRRCSENYWKLSSMACFFFSEENLKQVLIVTHLCLHVFLVLEPSSSLWHHKLFGSVSHYSLVFHKTCCI